MSQIKSSILVAAIALAMGVTTAHAVPGEHGGAGDHRGGPDFAGDFMPGGDHRGGNHGGHQAENPDQGDNQGSHDNGPPGLCGVDGSGPPGRAGRSNIAHLNFSQQDPDTGEILEDGSWARMKYSWAAPTFNFVLNGHELPVGGEYTLTYQPQPTPSPGVICLGDGVVNDEGDLHIANDVELNGDLPMPEDETEDGALLAVVVSGDVDCEAGEMLTFMPVDYLFGNAFIQYVDTDVAASAEDGGDSGDGGDG